MENKCIQENFLSRFKNNLKNFCHKNYRTFICINPEQKFPVRKNIMFNIKSINPTAVRFCLSIIIVCCLAQIISAQINIGGYNITLPKRKPKTEQPPSPNQTATPNQTTNQRVGDSAQSASKQSDDVELASEEINFNSNAPADYDANLKAGEPAIAVGRFGIEPVTIVSRSGDIYKVRVTSLQNSLHLYKANSVYPNFDLQTFAGEVNFGYGRYLQPYLPCYAQKHNLSEEQTRKEFYGGLGTNNPEIAKQLLQKNEPKLVEAGNLLKTKLSVRPNTYSSPGENPAVWDEITSNLDEYQKCVIDSIANKPSPILPIFLEDIQKAKSQVDRYQPGRNIYLVSAGAQSESLLRAVSPKAREEWSAKWLKNSSLRAKFNAAWDDLAASAKNKIPLYKPSVAGFQFRYPAGEKLLMDSFKNPSTLKILRIGTDTASWNIQKDNADLLPTYRYKDVRAYLRDSSDDHPYCKVVTARVKQDYSGGGTYNSTVYRAPVSEEIYGCP